MSSFIYPDSTTRKMYGQAGLKQQIKNQRTNFANRLAYEQALKRKEIDALKANVQAYENLKWYQKLWLFVLEMFGRKKSII